MSGSERILIEIKIRAKLMRILGLKCHRLIGKVMLTVVIQKFADIDGN
jgi:hypothetical protein